MWGIIPAAGRGSRIQPLAFSKELLPVGSRHEGDSDRPVAVSEYLVDRMIAAGVNKICFIISPGKSDILAYYGGKVRGAQVCFVVQNEPRGLCDALFCALPFISEDEQVCVGLPDTIWFPHDGLCKVSGADLTFLLFPVEHPELFDVVSVADDSSTVTEIQVKPSAPKSKWIWGAFVASGRVLHSLHALWQEPGRADEYFGTLVNAYLARGGSAQASRYGRAYVDVGSLHGYREATRLLEAVKLLEDVELAPAASAHSRYRLGSEQR
jgi:glucose-1-phosphate thymidylyltransferase